MSQMDMITALVSEGIQKNLRAHRKYIAAGERRDIADDSASVAIAVLIEMSGGNHHIVRSDGETFTLQHPLTERLTGDLLDCDLLRHIYRGERIPKGRYRVLMNDDDTDVDLIPLKEFE
ncbi:MAG TPA: DUF6085 family protein [Microbacterium sp.]|nr:DUF6085 family protein [Microbacterium sp.]